MAFADPVTLEGRHVRLEPMTHAGADAIAAALATAAADGAMWESKVTTIPRPGDTHAYVDQALKELDAGVSLPFVTVDRASGKAVGSTRYMNIEAPHRRLEIGTTWIGKSFQRTAINTEAKFLLLRHAFETLGCLRVELKTDALNQRSRAAIQRIGAREEGLFRKHMITASGRVRDTAYYAIVDDDWPAVKASLQSRLGLAQP